MCHALHTAAAQAMHTYTHAHAGRGNDSKACACVPLYKAFVCMPKPHAFNLPRMCVCVYVQAVSLEGRVYRLLEATPKDGKEFAAAVRQVLRRETSWVEWKKNRNLGECVAFSLSASAARPVGCVILGGLCGFARSFALLLCPVT